MNLWLLFRKHRHCLTFHHFQYTLRSTEDNHEEIAAPATVFLIAVRFGPTRSPAESRLTLPLREGWAVQSSAKVTGSGEAISSATYQAENWMQADVRLRWWRRR